MKLLAKGKADVLAYLESAALKRTDGKIGVYRLTSDDSGVPQLLIVAGYVFSAGHTVSGQDPFAASQLKVENSIVIDVAES